MNQPRTGPAPVLAPRAPPTRTPGSAPCSSCKGKVVLTGLGTPGRMAYVKDGTVRQFPLRNPDDLGCLGAYTAAVLASGRLTGAPGDTFKAD